MRNLKHIIAALALITATASAQSVIPSDLDIGDGPISLTADYVTYYRLDDRFIAEGHVVLTTSRFTLKCDELEVWQKEAEYEARGGVVVSGPEGEFKADSVRFNVKTKDGVVVNASLYIAEVHAGVSGERIEKIGPGTYLITGASFTPCLCDPGERPDWSIRAESMRIEDEGYARIRGGTFRIKDLPIFYIPFGFLPVKEKRQTGFLIPRGSYSSRDNFEFVIPFYWAASRWWDATIEEDFIYRRGIKQNLELRWKLGETNYGSLDLRYLDDWYVNENRFATALELTAPVGSFRINALMRYVSDNEYVRDFRSDGMTDDSRASWLEGGLLAVAPMGPIEAFVAARRIDDLRGDDIYEHLTFKDSDAIVPHLIPGLGLTLIETGIANLPLYVSAKLRADTFYRTGPTPIWNEPTRTIENEWSERIDLRPTLALAVERSGMYFNPRFGFRETMYIVTESDAAFRHVAEIRADAGLRAWKIYRGRFKHRVEPSVRYDYGYELDPAKRPRFDFTDDIGDRSAIEVVLDQRLFERREDAPGMARGTELVRLRASQMYDLETGDFGMSRGELDVRVSLYALLRFDVKYDLEAGQYQYASVGAFLTDPRRDSLSVVYRFQEPSQNFAITRAQVRLVKWFALTYMHYLDLEQMEFVDHGGGFILEPKSDCWYLDFSAYYHTDPREIRYTVRFNLLGPGR